MDILRSLTKSQRERLTIVRFHKDDILFHERDVCNEISFVLSGEIRISSYSLSGNEIVYNVIQSGGVFGNNLAFSSVPEYRGNVIASSDGELAYASKELILSLLRENEEFLKDYLRAESDLVKTLNSKLKIVSFPLAEERLDYLFYLRGKKIAFQNVSELAKELFLSREAVSRLIHKLEKEGKLKIGKGYLTLL